MTRHAVPPSILLAFVLAPSLASADALPEDETPPVVKITKPAARTELPAGTTKTTIEVSAEDEQSGVVEVRLLVDDQVVKTIDEAPWTFADIELTPGEHRIAAQAVNADVDEETSDPVVVVVAAAPPPEPPPIQPPPPQAKADAKAPVLAQAPPSKAEAAAAPATAPAPEPRATAAKDGCFASARPRSLVGSGVAFAIAVLAGLMLRRRS